MLIYMFVLLSRRVCLLILLVWLVSWLMCLVSKMEILVQEVISVYLP